MRVHEVTTGFEKVRCYYEDCNAELAHLMDVHFPHDYIPLDDLYIYHGVRNFRTEATTNEDAVVVQCPECGQSNVFTTDTYVETEFRGRPYLLYSMGEEPPNQLYVDDLRDTPEGFQGARTAEKAISLLANATTDFKVLSLDHDLGVDEDGNTRKTGYDLAIAVCANYYKWRLEIEEIYLHTDNPVGRNNMHQLLLGAKRNNLIPDDVQIYHYPHDSRR
jgi:hypothetical protein